jgi:hypothetical protein
MKYGHNASLSRIPFDGQRHLSTRDNSDGFNSRANSDGVTLAIELRNDSDLL